jgi:hypothetical protein
MGVARMLFLVTDGTGGGGRPTTSSVAALLESHKARLPGEIAAMNIALRSSHGPRRGRGTAAHRKYG